MKLRNVRRPPQPDDPDDPFIHRPVTAPSPEDWAAKDKAIKQEVARLLEVWGPPDPLPPYEDRPACPKCASPAVTIEYHPAGGHYGCSGGLSVQMAITFDSSVDHIARATARSLRMFEHHDRLCINCKYGWVTDVAT